VISCCFWRAAGETGLTARVAGTETGDTKFAMASAATFLGLSAGLTSGVFLVTTASIAFLSASFGVSDFFGSFIYATLSTTCFGPVLLKDWVVSLATGRIRLYLEDVMFMLPLSSLLAFSSRLALLSEGWLGFKVERDRGG
jgi:hypothetical protein